MKFLKSTQGAALVLCVAVVFSIGLGTVRTVNSAQKQLIEVFHEEALEFFNMRRDTGYNLHSVASRYLDSDSKSLAALKSACDAISASKTPADYQSSSDALTAAANSVMTELGSAALSESDASYVNGFSQEMENALFMLSKNSTGYNSEATQFNRTRLTVVARIFGFKTQPVFG